MARIKRYLFSTVAVMTMCNQLVKVEFNELPSGEVELTLLSVCSLEKVRGSWHPIISRETYKERPDSGSLCAAWALQYFGLVIKAV